MIDRYHLCESLSADRLIKLVNKAINNGWEPIGGVSITGDFHGTMVYTQAIIKRN